MQTFARSNTNDYLSAEVLTILIILDIIWWETLFNIYNITVKYS